MIRKAIVTMLLTLAAAAAGAQWMRPWSIWQIHEADTAKSNVHLSVGSAVESGFGNVRSVTWAAPSFSYRASDRLTLRGGFMLAGSLLPGGYALNGRGPQSLAPVREGTSLGSVWAHAEYKVGERMLVWGTVSHTTGFVQPLWSSRSLPVETTALSGGFAYRFEQGSLLAMQFHFVHERPETPFYGAYAPTWEIYSAPWPF